MLLKDKLDFILGMYADPDANAEDLSNLSGADLMELQEIADKLTEQIAVVLTARHLLMENNNDKKDIGV